jgi:hypothetical protein
MHRSKLHRYSMTLVSAAEQRDRDGEPERSGSLEIDDQFNFGGLLNQQIGWFLALENPAGIDAGSAKTHPKAGFPGKLSI